MHQIEASYGIYLSLYQVAIGSEGENNVYKQWSWQVQAAPSAMADSGSIKQRWLE
ncbi:hypothetical protein OF001_U280039 [Pseudomonas sp. OF001]|jgi:hypothetical protein|uniref:hypothetical protein n=1 Tax=Pseudomonas sp. OF001 TaxID=2772300 RepID=UPI00191B22BF|nr:hypothetical protein [Pseudomonas sp. OF001]CAD5378129.1 hypothetical protein OF001_U280039 [Pseudomonas sp. OF001]